MNSLNISSVTERCFARGQNSACVLCGASVRIGMHARSFSSMLDIPNLVVMDTARFSMCSRCARSK